MTDQTTDDDQAFTSAWKRARDAEPQGDGYRTFDLDGEPLRVMAVLPAAWLVDTIEKSGKAGGSASKQAVVNIEFLDKVLHPDSAKRVAERIESTTEPLTADDLHDLVVYLLNMWGGRPTTPASSSAESSDDAGEPSTQNAEASTPSDSPPTDS